MWSEGLDVRGEYRAPAYSDQRDKYVDQKPEFAIVCSACGQEAMVPFLPEEKESPMCRVCYRKKNIQQTDASAAAVDDRTEAAADGKTGAAVDEDDTPVTETE